MNKKKNVKKRISKYDIGIPKDFRQSGFDLKETENQRQEKEKREFMYDFEQQQDGGMVHSPFQTSLTSIGSNTKSIKDKTGKSLSKKDIGYPEHFLHVSHIGCDPQDSFDVNIPDVDEDWKTHFAMIGVTENQMEENKTREFTNDFVQQQVPQEIITRGAEAEKAYRLALEEGEVQVYRGRIMLIGQDRAGKTSLKKSLLGVSFDPQEPSTDGVDVDPSNFCVDINDAIDWQLSKDSDRKMDFEDNVATIMAELLNQSEEAKESESATAPTQVDDRRRKSEVIQDEKSAETTTEAYSIPHTNNLTDESISENVVYNLNENARASNQYNSENSYDGFEIMNEDQNKNYEMETRTFLPRRDARKDTVPETVMEKLIQRLFAKDIGSSSSQGTNISIWDFAGQQLYYASHPVFFSHRAVYILVYNQIKDLKAEAKPCVRQGVNDFRLENRDGETNLEAMLSWLVSVHSARPEGVEIRKKLPYLRPPVVIVGTHADCPFDEPNIMEAIIQKGITGKSYEQHVVRPFITVDNTQSCNDDGVKKLKDKVKDLLGTEPYMGEKVPIRWFMFEQVIESLVQEEGKNHMSLQDIKKLVLEVCEIKDQKETSALLNFYHDLGVIVKHGNTVVLKAEWLIDLFKKLITIRPFNEQDPVNSKLWSTLEQTGILEMDLVKHAFKDIIDSGETKDDILDMMERYGLIARFEGNENSRSYFVPAQLQSTPKEFLDVGPTTSGPCPLYLHFLDGFIPHGLYNCLVSRMITWCSAKGYPHKPRLYQSLSQFFIGCTYRYELFLIRRKRFVKVVLRSLEEERSWVFQPTAFLIQVFLVSSLKEITEECPWYQSLSYEISVRCPSPHARKCHRHQLESCPDDDCLHLLPIKDERVLVCSKNIGKASKPEVPGTEEWYREHPMIPEHSEEIKECVRGFSVNATLSDEQRRWLVVGIGLNKILAPTLRNFLAPKMLSLYATLKTNENIDKQVHGGQLTIEGKCNSLNYGSINDNVANHRKRVALYDYRVNSAADLAKLYLQPFMAKFSGFDDSCDLSAALGILSFSSAFSNGIQYLSKQVKNDVGNEWGHCNFSVWDEKKFKDCFKLMKDLVKALTLPPKDEKKTTEELKEWKTKGLQLCIGSIVNADLLKFIESSDAELERLGREVKDLQNREQNEDFGVSDAFEGIRSNFEMFRDDINKKFESLEQKIKGHDREIQGHDREIQALKLAIRQR